MRAVVVLAAVVVGIPGAAVAQAPEGRPSAEARELHRLFQDAWAYRLREDPLFATRVGEHRYDDRLPHVTEADWRRRLEREREFLERLRSIDRSELDPADRLNRDTFARLARSEIRELELRGYLLPFTTFSAFYADFPELPDRMPFETAEHYERYLARIEAFDRWVTEYIELMRTGLEEGYTLPRVVLGSVPASLRAQMVEDPAESPLWEPFEALPESIDPARAEALRTRGRHAIRRSVVPGYRTFLDFMEREYIPGARESIGASDLPAGDAFYAHRVRRYTTLDVTPREVHETGLREVERIRGRMEAIIDSVGFEGSFAEFIDFLRTDERFYVDTPETLLKEVSLVLKRMDGKLPELVGTLPRMSYGIREVPAFVAPQMTSAYYSRPSGDGTRAGFYYVNTYDLPSRPLYEVEALSFHEAVPGHHLQIALQQELEDVPPFRRFASFTAFVEGWALYAERLGKEVGFYRDPYSDFGRLTYEMWRACRLVVDTGMHAFGWSRGRAIDFMAENTALTRHNIAAEVDRYISWPGQALGYKMGELRIRELRRRAEERLGPAFDRRAFHDVVLGAGALPLTLLEDRVDRWIEETASGS